MLQAPAHDDEQLMLAILLCHLPDDGAKHRLVAQTSVIDCTGHLSMHAALALTSHPKRDSCRCLAMFYRQSPDQGVPGDGVCAADDSLGARPGRAQRAEGADMDAFLAAVPDELGVAPQGVYFHLRRAQDSGSGVLHNVESCASMLTR